jgi:NADH:ubiquinone oxidoreductase subunit 2 (subunit N)
MLVLRQSICETWCMFSLCGLPWLMGWLLMGSFVFFSTRKGRDRVLRPLVYICLIVAVLPLLYFLLYVVLFGLFGGPHIAL